MVFGRAAELRHSSDKLFELLKLAAATQSQDQLSHTARKASLKDVNEQLSDVLAGQGFSRSDDGMTATNEISVSFVICGTYAIVSRTESQQTLQHSPNCQFQPALEVFNGMTRPRSPTTETLQDHLETEMKTTKTQVACEMGYDADVVCTAYGVHFLRQKKGFENAGALVEFLIDHDSSNGEESLTVITGLAEVVNFPSVHSKSKEKQTSSQTSTKESTKLNEVVNGKRDGQLLLEETMTLYCKTLCKSCCKKKAACLVQPCHHLSLCDDCVKEQLWCPLCQTEITSHVKVYF